MEHSYDGSNGRTREAIVAAFIDQQHFCLPLQFVFETPEARFAKELSTFKQLLGSVTVDPNELKGNIEITVV